MSGSDGCNYLSGSYRFGRDGTVKFQVGQPKRLYAEPNPPSPLQNTVRLKVRSARLVFLAPGGRELANYARGKAAKPKRAGQRNE